MIVQTCESKMTYKDIASIQRYGIGYIGVNYYYDTGFISMSEGCVLEAREGCYLEITIIEVKGIAFNAKAQSVYLYDFSDIKLNIKDMKGYSNKYRFNKDGYLQIKERPSDEHED